MLSQNVKIKITFSVKQIMYQNIINNRALKYLDSPLFQMFERIVPKILKLTIPEKNFHMRDRVTEVDIFKNVGTVLFDICHETSNVKICADEQKQNKQVNNLILLGKIRPCIGIASNVNYCVTREV